MYPIPDDLRYPFTKGDIGPAEPMMSARTESTFNSGPSSNPGEPDLKAEWLNVP